MSLPLYDDLPLNYRFSAFKVLSLDNLKPEFPLHFQMDLVGTCNNHCPFCFFRDEADNFNDIERNPIRKKRLDTNLVLKTLDELKSRGVQAITLTGGGESLIHKDINLILEHIHKHDFELGIMSNLNIMPDLELMRKTKWLRVSLDAATHESYQKIHGPGAGVTFKTVTDHMRSLAGHVDLGMSFLVCQDNWREIKQAVELAHDIGVNYIQFKLVNDSDKSQSLLPHRGELMNLMDEALAFNQKQKNPVEIIDLLGRISLIEKQPRLYRQCYIHYHTGIIGADAKLYLCCLLKYDDHFCLGSLENSTINELWDGPLREKLLDEFDKEKCPSCFYEKTNEVIDYMLSQNNPHKFFV